MSQVSTNRGAFAASYKNSPDKESSVEDSRN